MSEPYGYAFQHEETGLQQVVDVQQVEWGFEKNNPRWKKLGPVYFQPPTDSETIEALKARVAELERLVYVPGLWKCAKCKFSLMQATISAHSGAIGTRDEPGERCPNCDVPLWRVTERDSGNELAVRCEEAILECIELRKDKVLLDALAGNYWDLRCVSSPIADTGDGDVDWMVIGHHMAAPCEREVARAYTDDPRVAIRRAARASDKDAERCVACDEVLHDGDSVYYENCEGGHLHASCAGDDPESFVDEDEVPLKKDDAVPAPFAYRVEGRADV